MKKPPIRTACREQNALSKDEQGLLRGKYEEELRVNALVGGLLLWMFAFREVLRLERKCS